MERQNQLKQAPRAARSYENVVQLETIEAKSRPIRCPVTSHLDSRLSKLDNMYYIILNLGPTLGNLQCWQRWRVICDMRKGMPSGSVEHWTWQPGGSRIGIVAHVITVDSPTLLPGALTLLP